jgi:hypothetical protein
MKVNEKIEQLIETRINGNSFEVSNTYKKLLKSIKLSDIREYALEELRVPATVSNLLTCITSKEEMINIIVNYQTSKGLI